MLKSLSLAACLLAAACASTPAASKPDDITVRLCDGGLVQAYQAWAREIMATGQRVRFDGPTLSACTIAADMLRKGHACVTPNAVMQFHALGWMDETGSIQRQGLMQAPYSADLYRWLFRHGGLPVDGWLEMRAPETAQFWETCT